MIHLYYTKIKKKAAGFCHTYKTIDSSSCFRQKYCCRNSLKLLEEYITDKAN